jgi:uncharacterized protein
MKKMQRIVGLLLVSAMIAWANTLPSIHQVYEAVATGHLQEANKMIQTVLQARPQSAKAHYVAAEVYVRQGHRGAAAKELRIAQKIAPGLPFANPNDVRVLEQRINYTPNVAAQSKSSWLPYVLFAAAIFFLVLIWKSFASKRATGFGGYPPAKGNAQNTQGPQGPLGGGSQGSSFGGSGMGSSILGGLATGAAMGAGFAAGERIVDDLMGGSKPSDTTQQVSGTDNYYPDDNDFGISDGDSWSDGGGDFGTDDGSW